VSEYASYDYQESLKASNIDPTDVERVIAAWGLHGDYSEWEGGFILAMKDGRFAYVWGWCDTTGWGCQDGGGVKWFDTEPDRTILRGTPQHMGGYLEALSGEEPKANKADWDEAPADLNRWHSLGCPAESTW
jgi:hypothetical protein